MPKKPNGKPAEELQETQPAKGDPVMIPQVTELQDRIGATLRTLSARLARKLR